jgi:hypothetical protein
VEFAAEEKIFWLKNESGHLINMETILIKCCGVLYLLLCLQSLVDVARQEEERRKRLDEQGIEAKVITGAYSDFSSNGNVSESTTEIEESPRISSSSKPDEKQKPVSSYRNALQKLDRAIRQNEDRLKLYQARLLTEKRTPPPTGRSSKKKTNPDPPKRLKEQIEDLELKLKQLRQERMEIYDEGKRAGYLPGELDGKGIVP